MSARTSKWRLGLAIVLAAGLIGVYLTSITVQTRQPGPLSGEIQELRRLAISDHSRLADLLDARAVLVPAGESRMGTDSGPEDERPQHSVYLDAFEIDRYEVTNAQYRRFVQATDRRAPPYWSNGQFPSGQSDYPVVGVSWDDADAYCAWAGKRLPTEAEWEKACRGVDARVYPWGDAWQPRRANVAVAATALPLASQPEPGREAWDAAWGLLQATPVADAPGLRPVGSFQEGASPYRVMDMAGNASEWVADWYNWSDYTRRPARNPHSDGPPWNHCVRGSPWLDPAGNAGWPENESRCAARSSSHADWDPRVGFRCARSVK